MERQLIEDYEAAVTAALPRLTAGNLAQVIELANLPEQIRGFGHVKLASVEKVKARWAALEQGRNGGAAGPGVSRKAA